MIAHHEVLAWRNDEVAVFDVIGQVDHPRSYGAVRIFHGGQDGGEIIRISALAGRQGQCRALGGQRLRDAVDEHGAVAQMDVIARHANQALDRIS